MAAAVLLVTFTVPAMAADWNFYGSARMLLEWRNTDFQVVDRFLPNAGTGGGFDDTDLAWTLLGTSRMGANVKVSDTISGVVEMGWAGAPGLNVGVRQIYGEWNLGNYQILIGHEYTPILFFASGSVSNDFAQLAYGGFYVGRNDQIKLKFGKFHIALVEPSTFAPALYAAQDTDTTIPKIEARWSGNMGPFFVSIGAGYNTIDIVNTATDAETSVDSYVANLGLRYNIGAFGLAGQIWIASNSRNYGKTELASGAATVNAAGTGIADTDSMGFLLSAKYKMSDMVSFGVGYGWYEHSQDLVGTQDDDGSSYYINMPLTLAKGVSLTPEFSVFDYGDNLAGADEGSSTAFTVWWGIFF